MEVFFIRHSMTKGNLLHRYIGKTDENLCSEGIKLVRSKSYPEIEGLYCSPMLRCIETAGFIYEKLNPVIVKDLRECDFGDFENKNYNELNGNDDYQKWIDSGGKLPFPGGEAIDDFKERCVKAFDFVIDDAIKKKYKSISLIVHGGTIMSILDRYSYPNKKYYNWQIKNGESISSFVDEKEWLKGIRKIVIS